MSRIRGKDTRPEVILRKALHREGLRFRVHGKGIPGRPDIFWKGRKVAVFVDGCFWHACPSHFTRPLSNRRFWDQKIKGNVRRDRRIRDELASQGWTVVELWEHDVADDLTRCVRVIRRAIERSS